MMKKKHASGLLSALVSAAMVFGMVPTPALAEMVDEIHAQVEETTGGAGVAEGDAPVVAEGEEDQEAEPQMPAF